MKKCFTVFSAASLVVLVTGCATPPPPTVNTISNAIPVAQIKRVIDQRVTTDAILEATLAMTEIRESVTNDGFMRIQVFMKNLSMTSYSFAYRFDWYDEQGVKIDVPDGDMWLRGSAIGGDDVTLTSVAPGRNCRDFKLRIIAAQ